MKLKREEKFTGIETIGDTLGFHGTALEDYLRCPRKFYYRHIIGLKLKSENAALVFGRAIHQSLFVWFALQKDPLYVKNFLTEEELSCFDSSLSPILIRDGFSLQAFLQEFEPSGIETDKINSSVGQEILKNYFETYRNITEQYDPRNLEITQKVMMPNGTLIVVTLDRLFVSENFVKIEDTKTTSRPLTDFFWKTFENSFQLKGYYYACKQVYDVDTVQIDAIQYPPAKTQKDEVLCERRSFLFSDLQIEDYLNTYNIITNEIIAGMALPEDKKPNAFHTCETSCSDYGGCPYLPICKYGYNHPSVQVMFERS